MSAKEWTYTSQYSWSAQHKLGGIPRLQDKQIELLDRAIYELVNWLQDELGHDNNTSIFDGLADEVNLIAQRSYKRNCD